MTFPFTRGGVSEEERQAPGAGAYLLSAHDELSCAVRVSAAEALEAN
ncbi:hypothetical protein OIE71_34350 [Streptomyces sp. NBC_01725]|nr:hypothetical protein [Streptomyces sp. NBC_01725]